LHSLRLPLLLSRHTHAFPFFTVARAGPLAENANFARYTQLSEGSAVRRARHLLPARQTVPPRERTFAARSGQNRGKLRPIRGMGLANRRAGQSAFGVRPCH
jgi:hypothetical protein